MSGLALVAALLLASPARADTCQITGRLTEDRVRVTSVEGRAPRYVALEGAEAIVTPVRHGLVRIESTLPDGRAFRGESRTEPAYEVREHASLPGLELGAGVAVLDLRPIEGSAEAEVDLLLAPGVTLREARIACSLLALVEGERRPGDLAYPADLASPRLMPRSRDLHVTVGETVLRLRFAAHDEVVLLERRRTEARLEVVLPLPSARVTGSVEARDVRPVVDSLVTRHRWYRRSVRP